MTHHGRAHSKTKDLSLMNVEYKKKNDLNFQHHLPKQRKREKFNRNY